MIRASITVLLKYGWSLRQSRQGDALYPILSQCVGSPKVSLSDPCFRHYKLCLLNRQRASAAEVGCLNRQLQKAPRRFAQTRGETQLGRTPKRLLEFLHVTFVAKF